MLNLLNQKRSKNFVVFMISSYFMLFKNVAMADYPDIEEDNNIAKITEDYSVKKQHKSQLEVTGTATNNNSYWLTQSSNLSILRDNAVPVIDLTDSSNKIDFLENNLTENLEQINEKNRISAKTTEFAPETYLTKNTAKIDRSYKIEDLTNNQYNDNQQLITELQNRVIFLETEFYKLQHKVDTLYQDSRDRHIDLDERVMILRSELQKMQTKNVSDTKESNILNSNANSSTISRIAEINNKINIVKVLMKDGKYQQSKDILLEIEKKLPLTAEIAKTHPEIFEVYYWRTEVDILLNDLNGALAISKQMVTCFDNHERMPELLYKLGYLFETTGNSKESHKILKSIVTKYPHSSSASLAKKILRKERIHIK